MKSRIILIASILICLAAIGYHAPQTVHAQSTQTGSMVVWSSSATGPCLVGTGLSGICLTSTGQAYTTVNGSALQSLNGAQGPAGAIGPAGPSGPAGAPGATGAQGPAGPTWSTCTGVTLTPSGQGIYTLTVTPANCH